MTDEEKQEYEEAKLYLTHTGVDDFNLEKHQSENRIWAIKILLNLIEKQSKEIEELKNYYRELYKQNNSPNEFLIEQDCLSKISILQEVKQSLLE